MPCSRQFAKKSMLVVDTNAGEHSVHATLVQRFGDAVERRRLDVGDVMISSPDDPARTVIIERKTWLDWAKSLRDGRYADQKARLLSDGAASTATIVYIIEGHIHGWWGQTGPAQASLPNSTLEAAIVKTSLRDQIHVLRTKDTAHTCALIGYLYEQVRSGTLFAPTTTQSVGGVTSKRRRDNLKPWQAMLMALPGMSALKAEALAEAYPSMKIFGQASEKELASVLVPGKKKPRKLGPALAKQLVALH